MDRFLKHSFSHPHGMFSRHVFNRSSPFPDCDEVLLIFFLGKLLPTFIVQLIRCLPTVQLSRRYAEKTYLGRWCQTQIKRVIAYTIKQSVKRVFPMSRALWQWLWPKEESFGLVYCLLGPVHTFWICVECAFPRLRLGVGMKVDQWVWGSFLVFSVPTPLSTTF